MLRDGSGVYHLAMRYRLETTEAASHVTTCQSDQSGGIAHPTGLGSLS
jgi:hypothetical protein